MNVVDTSALLAFLQGEDGADTAEQALVDGARCSAANWSETAQKILAKGRNWTLASSLLASYRLVVEPVIEADAEWAARRWKRGEDLSLGDRLCLATAERLDAVVWTADSRWGTDGRIRQIR